ncbi:MAG: sugar ABC transporter permease [Firmicutes bacterium]|nr:sugar ABC transporter permease [Bacillota bacterium]
MEERRHPSINARGARITQRVRSFQRRLNRLSEQSFAYLLLSPTIIILVLLGVFPVLYSFGLSFFKYRLNVARPPVFVGLANYGRMLTDPDFWSSIVKALYFTVLMVSLTVILALIVALLLNQNLKGKTFYLAALLIPWAVPKVVGGLIWKWIYDGNYGILNAIAVKLGLIKQYQWWFVRSPVLALSLIVMVEVWRSIPFAAVLLYAALNNIPSHLYRAAHIDGANAWQRFRFVTLPGIKYVLMVVLILQTTWALKTFDTIYILTSGGPGTSTMVTYFYVYRNAFDYLDIGYGSALAYTLAMLVLGLAIIYKRALRKT